MNMELFQTDPREYALNMLADGLVPADSMVSLLLSFMSHDEVRGALDANELSPRFNEEEDEEDEEEN